MKIEPEANSLAQNFVPAMDNIRVNRLRNYSPEFNVQDFESCINEIGEDTKKEEIIVPTQQVSQVKQQEIACTSSNTEDNKLKTHNIAKIDNIKFGLYANERFKFDDIQKIGIEDLKKEDIDFLKEVSGNAVFFINNLNFQNLQINAAVQNQQGVVSYKSMDVSRGLFNLIEYSFKAKKPIRVDFSKDSSVILKMNKEGKVSAEFISNDEAMAYIIKSSLPGLKNKMDTEGILYDDIFYNDRNQNKEKNNKKGAQQ